MKTKRLPLGSMNRWLYEREGQYSSIVTELQEWLRTASGHKHAILYVRVSTISQRKDTAPMIERLEKLCDQAGIEVVEYFTERRNGRIGTYFDSELLEAVKLAKQTGSPILAYSADRYLRTANWIPSDLDSVKPSKFEFEELAEALDGVKLLSVIHPDASYSDLQSAKSASGKENSEKRQGRPLSMKARKLRIMQLIKEEQQDGKSKSSYGWSKWLRSEHKLEVSHMTLLRWNIL